MKVMVNATCAQAGNATGIERFAVNIARELYHIDPSVVVVAAAPIPGVPTALVSKFIACSRKILGKHEFLARALWDQIWFRLLVIWHKPDIIFFPIQDGLFFPPVKQVITIHDLHYSQLSNVLSTGKSEIPFYRRVVNHGKMPHLIAASAAVVTVSEVTKADVGHIFDLREDKLSVVYNGYDEQRFRVIENPDARLHRYGLRRGAYLLFVGSILRHKNLLNLLKAYLRLDCGLKLVIVGPCKDCAYLREMELLLEQHRLPKGMVSYLDYIGDEDLPYLYAGALLFVLPSLHEGFGVPIIEAMACGVPVVTSNCAAMPEVAGGAALLVDPESVDSIEEGMRLVVENEQTRSQLKALGLERARQFSWSASGATLYHVLKALA